jgi:opacity protein-like surface antigen
VSFKKESEEIMKRILTGAVLGLSLVAAGTAAAQDAAGPRSPIQFGVMGGVTFPIGSNLTNTYKTGWNAGALLNFGMVNWPFGLRVDGSWNQFNRKDTNDSHLRLLDATADAVFNIGTKSPAQLYVLGGVGVYNFKITGDNNNLDFSSGSTTKFGLNGGVGVKFKAGPLAPFLEARYHYVFSGNYFANTGGGSSKFQMIPISIGLTF